MRKFLLLCVAVLLARPATADVMFNQALNVTIDTLTARSPFDHAIWAIRIEEEDGTPLYSRNAHTLVMPASNRKLFASAVVADCFGWEGQFETQVWSAGEDLVLRGGGDPSFGGRYYEPSANALIRFVDAVRRRGIGQLRDVVADVSLFDRTTIPPSWKVGNLPYKYAAPVDALTFEENTTATGSVPEPALSAAQALRDALTAAGVRITGVVRVCPAGCFVAATPPQLLATVTSPYVQQLLSTVLENSQNLYTEVLFKNLSLPRDRKTGQVLAPPMMQLSGEGATALNSMAMPANYAASLETERRFLVDEVHVDPAEFRFVDGSGLSPDDLLTVQATITLLRWMNVPGRGAHFRDAMSKPGMPGTLRHRLEELQPRLRAKTGTINGVNALSGFVSGREGRLRYFSIIINHHIGDSDEGEKIIDDIVRALADF